MWGRERGIWEAVREKESERDKQIKDRVCNLVRQGWRRVFCPRNVHSTHRQNWRGIYENLSQGLAWPLPWRSPCPFICPTESLLLPLQNKFTCPAKPTENTPKEKDQNVGWCLPPTGQAWGGGWEGLREAEKLSLCPGAAGVSSGQEWGTHIWHLWNWVTESVSPLCCLCPSRWFCPNPCLPVARYQDTPAAPADSKA